jgi:hypothetical protein
MQCRDLEPSHGLVTKPLVTSSNLRVLGAAHLPAAVAAAARAAPTPAAALALFNSALSASPTLSPLAVLPHLTAATPSLPHLLLSVSITGRPYTTSLSLYSRLKSLSFPTSPPHPSSPMPSVRALQLLRQISLPRVLRLSYPGD